MEAAEHVQDWRRDVLEAIAMEPNARGTVGEPLTIMLDEQVVLPMRPRNLGHYVPTTTFAPIDSDSDDEVKPRKVSHPIKRSNSNRDSQRRRNLLLVGKEGSRQRRRWENDRLMHVPNAQPPLPSDWEVRPTHTVHYDLPYHLAQFWDCGMREMINERRAAEAIRHRQQLIAHQSQTPVPTPQKKKSSKKSPKKAKSKKQTSTSSSGSVSPSPTFGMVTRDLRVAVKKSETIKLWVRALEEPVRQYVFAAEAARRALDSRETQTAASTASSSSVSGDDDEDRSYVIPSNVSTTSGTYDVSDQDDDELVFVGRRSLREKEAQASWKHAHREINNEPIDSGILFDSLGNGETGSFK
ncbi:hypothetical protein SBRCBS47491_001063 [Sporothrix bragantina]|uniref:R3H-associated N-terminal domain-containing protein n=1 Tax=Sporothrix bragantina TaxID=671064 RepID=A0ABP0AVJ9_9PEZI